MRSAAGFEGVDCHRYDPQIPHLEQVELAATAQGEISGGASVVQIANRYDSQIAHLEQAWQCAEGERPRGCRVKSAGGGQGGQPTTEVSLDLIIVRKGNYLEYEEKNEYEQIDAREKIY